MKWTFKMDMYGVEYVMHTERKGANHFPAARATRLSDGMWDVRYRLTPKEKTEHLILDGGVFPPAVMQTIFGANT